MAITTIEDCRMILELQAEIDAKQSVVRAMLDANPVTIPTSLIPTPDSEMARADMLIMDDPTPRISDRSRASVGHFSRFEKSEQVIAVGRSHSAHGCRVGDHRPLPTMPRASTSTFTVREDWSCGHGDLIPSTIPQTVQRFKLSGESWPISTVTTPHTKSGMRLMATRRLCGPAKRAPAAGGSC